MSKKHEPATVEVLQCMCYGEGITVEAWEDDEQIFLAMWERAHSEPLSFRQRLRCCAKVVWTGRPFADMVVLDRDRARRLIDMLVKGLKVLGKEKKNG